MAKPTVFISYSHKDEIWKDRLVTHLGVLQRQGLLDLWDDRRIGAGEDWRREIQEAMDAASVALLLVSAHFLTSPFILGEEVPRLLERRDGEGLRIFPIIVKPCVWRQVGWLARMGVRPQDGRPLSAGDEHQIDADLAAIAEEVADIVNRSAPTRAETRVEESSGQAPVISEPRPAADDQGCDVFISYSSRDADWVRGWLLPRLEGAGLRACIDYRDFEIGVATLVNIERAVEACPRTLLVLSPNWVGSEWTSFESLLLQTEDPAGLRRRLLPLMLRKCELPKRLGILTYADFRDPANREAELARLLGQIGTERS